MATALPKLKAAETPIDPPDDARLDDGANKLGIALPPSYREFARKYGYGLTGDLFMIYVPVDTRGAEWSEDLAGMSKTLAGELKAAIDAGYFKFAPDGSREIAVRLVPFGASENGHVLAWDPGAPGAGGELPIYTVGSRKDYLVRAADSLGDFLTKMSRPKQGGMFLGATDPLPPKFEPRPAKG